HETPTLFPYTTLFRSYERGGHHPKKRRALWPATGRCGLRTPILSNLSVCPRGVGRPTKSRLLLSCPNLELRENRPRCHLRQRDRSEEHTSELQSRFDL